MRHIKSERLKKLESELIDLEQWLKLGLVPKKDIEKHREEILGIRSKIEEERERLQFLKESGDTEDYITPKKQATRAAYTEMPTIPDVDIGDTVAAGMTDGGYEISSENTETESGLTQGKEDDDEKTSATEEDESYFSERNRWRRGGILDPDANDW